jgi:ferredoxin
VKILSADPEVCSGCGRCELACSFGRTRTYSHTGSVIRLVRVEELGLDVPVACIACSRCVSACPSGALSRTDEGRIEVDTDTCDGCGTCMDSCPVGIVEFETVPFFCTHCGRCVEACDLDALAFVDVPAPGETETDREASPALRRFRRALSHASRVPWIEENDVRLCRESLEG